MSKVSKILIPVTLLLVGFVLMNWFLGMRENEPKRSPQIKPRIVETTQVTLSEVPASVTAFGKITSAQPLSLYSEAKGTIENGDVIFQPAQRFTRDQVIVRIDDQQVDLDRRSAISDLLSALANVLPQIKTDFPDIYPDWLKYFETISFDDPLSDLPEAENQKIKLYLSRFSVYKLYFQVKDIEILQSKYTIRAPFDGSIVDAALRAGSTARDGSLLGSIINLEDLEVALPLPASEIDWLDPARKVTLVSSEFAGQFEGRIKRVGSSINAKTQTVPVFIELLTQPDQALFDGIFLEAELPGKTLANAIEVPRRAIYDERFVYLISDGKFVYREVQVVREQKYSVIVNGGLHDGDTLVLEPLQGVTPGMPAKSKMIPHAGGGN